jgi:hypothetical protein
MSEHGGTSLSQLTIDAKIIALYSTLSQTLVDKYEYLALIGTTLVMSTIILIKLLHSK